MTTHQKIPQHKPENSKRKFTTTKEIGNFVENWVCDELTKQGLHLVYQNFKSPFGEIDIIMQDKNTLIFIEVRYRKSDLFGDGLDTITKSKQKKIIRTAQCFCSFVPNLTNKHLRFDAVSVTGQLSNLKMTWIPDAFSV